MQSEVQAFQDECSRDLEAAEPIIAEAEAALNSLDKASLTELRSFGSPAAEIVQVVAACMVLTAPGGKIPKDLSWNAGKKTMGNVDAFLKSLVAFDKVHACARLPRRPEKTTRPGSAASPPPLAGPMPCPLPSPTPPPP